MGRHLVARCPTCERPIWAKQLAKLLNMVPFARRFSEVAFVAVTKGPGQGRGWKPAGVLRTLQEVGQHAGPEAVSQLRAVALQGFERAWLQGLIVDTDVRRIMAMQSFPRAVDAPVPPIRPMAFQPGAPGGRPSPAQTPPTLAPSSPPTTPPPIVPLDLTWRRAAR